MVEKAQDNEWCCDGADVFIGGCKSGQKDLGSHPGILCWRCIESHPEEEEACDFDLCEQCLRWVYYCAETGTALGANEENLRKVKEAGGKASEDPFDETGEEQKENKEGFFDVKV